MVARRSFLRISAFGSLAGLSGALFAERARAAEPLTLAGQRHDGADLPAGAPQGWVLAYFGYTLCPDVCPVGLLTMTQALEALGPLAEKVTPVFVTVDPERDRPDVLAQYLSFFHPRFVGLSPTDAQLQAMAKAWRVKYARVEPGEGRPYLMDHTASIFLRDPAGAPAGRFPHGMDAEQMAEKIRMAMASRS